MMSTSETIKRGEAAFRVLFTSPGAEGELKVADTPFVKLLKGVIDTGTGKGGELTCADCFNER